jgi:hypothetical protein
MKLREIPRYSKIKIKDNLEKDVFIQFLHLDGAYSYCVIEDDNSDNVIHLSANTPLKKVEDHYELDEINFTDIIKQ